MTRSPWQLGVSEPTRLRSSGYSSDLPGAGVVGALRGLRPGPRRRRPDRPAYARRRSAPEPSFAYRGLGAPFTLTREGPAWTAAGVDGGRGGGVVLKCLRSGHGPQRSQSTTPFSAASSSGCRRRIKRAGTDAGKKIVARRRRVVTDPPVSSRRCWSPRPVSRTGRPAPGCPTRSPAVPATAGRPGCSSAARPTPLHRWDSTPPAVPARRQPGLPSTIFHTRVATWRFSRSSTFARSLPLMSRMRWRR